jgi:hypothetical protein
LASGVRLLATMTASRIVKANFGILAFGYFDID